MIYYYHAVREVANQIAEAASGAIDAYREKRIEQEPAFTDRMLGGIEERLKNKKIKGICWNAKTFTDRGIRSQESLYGADFMGVLRIDLPDYKIKKGFLAQAKIIKNGVVDDVKRLREQCEKMLSLSPQSFVFFYDEQNIRIVPAHSVMASNDNYFPLYSKSLQKFFEEHLKSFIGDTRIGSADIKVLYKLQSEHVVRSILLVEGGKNDSL
jgi:hypothetical protein